MPNEVEDGNVTREIKVEKNHRNQMRKSEDIAKIRNLKEIIPDGEGEL